MTDKSTNTNIIEINQSKIGTAGISTVNARDLHSFLECKQEYSNWINSGIERCNFIEGSDFTIDININDKNRQIDHRISVDMAKELSMVECSKKGKAACKYFADRKQQVKQRPQLNDPNWLRGSLLTYTEKVIELQEQVDVLLPAQAALDKIAEADGSLCITDAAKSLQMRPKDLFSYLQENGWIYKRVGCAHYLGYQPKITQGLIEHKVTTVFRGDGSEKITEQVRILPKGLAKLAKLLPRSAHAA